MTDSLSPRVLNLPATLSDIVYGQDDAVRLAVMGVLAGGHLLFVGVPGVAKTRLVKAMGKFLGLDVRRIQGTPDLVPADITGFSVIEEGDYGRRNSRFIQGPIFCQMLMVDEINRISPRTQSALLQAMQELTVTIEGREHALPSPFHVVATQNPLEYESVWPLPEAQLDRFIMRIDINYPDEATEKRIMLDPANLGHPTLRAEVQAEELVQIQQRVKQISLPESLADRIVRMVRNGRPDSTTSAKVKRAVLWGPGPRSGQAIGLLARAAAFLDGRSEATIDDVRFIARPALRHRMAIKPEARAEQITVAMIIDELLAGL